MMPNLTDATFPAGLYAIADTATIGAEQLAQSVAYAIKGGAVAVQYRDKSEDQGRRLWEANELVFLCRSQRVPLIINDDVELARACRADGVHLGKDDGSVEEARRVLGDTAIIGKSCYNSLELALAAQAEGADYVAFGSFFSSMTKPHAMRAEIALLTQARAALNLPIVAIGGITPDNGAGLVRAGAHALAVCHALFANADSEAQARRFSAVFNS